MSSDRTETTRRIKLLLVDDEQGYVNILSKRLSRRNFAVTGVQSGEEAIQALRKQDFDVAVLDLKMEGMDGIEVLRVFKKLLPQMTRIGTGSQGRFGIRSI